jgi:hypothetical protein
MLIMLPALLLNGLVLAFATRTYPHDVAAAIVSTERSRSDDDDAQDDRPDR